MDILGLDIGGTKCAVIRGCFEEGELKIVAKKRLDTLKTLSPAEMTERMLDAAAELFNAGSRDECVPSAVGISCGGPLDSRAGVIKSPPNLLGWDDFPICELVRKKYPVKVNLQNDANACAVAEWKFGAGRGCENMLFLTFGTGLGAGLILGGKLYSGANDMAGEVGHIRLERFGPVGYGKKGSFEGFCSGGGIAQLAENIALEGLQSGKPPRWFTQGKPVSAKEVAEAASSGDPTALEVYRVAGDALGRGLSVLVDILNPERIVLGSIFVRSRDLLLDSMNASLRRESLPLSLSVCEVVPAELGENLGDYAALSTALL